MSLRGNELKKVLVVGAGRGIGLKTVRQLLADNCSVLAVSRKLDNLEELKKENPNLQTYSLDISSQREVHSFSQYLSKNYSPDILVFTAGVGRFGDLQSMEEEDWNTMFDTNAKGFFLIIKELRETLIESCHQVIVITSDVSTRTSSRAAIYSASKHAQRALLRSFQMEFGEAVRFTEIKPGNVATEFAGIQDAKPTADYLDPDDIVRAINFSIQSGPLARVDEIQIRPTGREILY